MIFDRSKNYDFLTEIKGRRELPLFSFLLSLKPDRMYDAPAMSAPKVGRTVFEFHGFKFLFMKRTALLIMEY